MFVFTPVWGFARPGGCPDGDHPLTRCAGAARGMVALTVICVTAGCQVDRPWFQIDSNSRMPFLGFDLLPRRTALNELSHGPDWPAEQEPAEATAKPVAEQKMQELRLPRLSSLFERDEEIPLNVEGPKRPFNR